MKRQFFKIALVCLAVLMLGFAACSPDPGATPQPMVCFGDSLTAGYDESTGQDDKVNSYPAYLQAKLKAEGVDIPMVNAGVSGNTSAQGFSRLQTDVVNHNPRSVIINFGANDFMQGIIAAAMATVLGNASFDATKVTDDIMNQTKENLQAMIDGIKAGACEHIYITKFYTKEVLNGILSIDMSGYVPDFVAALKDDEDFKKALYDKYNAMFEDLAESNGVNLIEDIWTGIWGEHMSGKIHPDATGYKKMAEEHIYLALKTF
jgi:acyl-CoA thioesterase-1